MNLQPYLKQLGELAVPVVHVQEWSLMEDAIIELGWPYQGIHLSIGLGYYSVVRELPDGHLRFVHGDGRIYDELLRALESTQN